MKYASVLGWGITIYASMSLLWSGFITYGFVEGLAPRIVGLLVLIGLGLLAGSSLRLYSWSDILPYAIMWAVMMAILDAIFSVPYAGWQLYTDLNVWFGYAVVVVAPLFAPYLRLVRLPSRPPNSF
jgi:hypothetical protein